MVCVCIICGWKGGHPPDPPLWIHTSLNALSLREHEAEPPGSHSSLSPHTAQTIKAKHLTNLTTHLYSPCHPCYRQSPGHWPQPPSWQSMLGNTFHSSRAGGTVAAVASHRCQGLGYGTVHSPHLPHCCSERAENLQNEDQQTVDQFASSCFVFFVLLHAFLKV